MNWNIIKATRNLLFDIFLQNIFNALVSFRVLDIYQEQLTHSTVLQKPEDIQRLAESEAERFIRPPLRRTLFIGTRQHLLTIYTRHFIEYYNITIKKRQTSPQSI